MRRLPLLGLAAALALGLAACGSPAPAVVEAQRVDREAALRRAAEAEARAQEPFVRVYRPDVDSTIFHSRPMLLDASVGEDGAQLAFLMAAVRYAGPPGAPVGPASPLLLFYRETETGRTRFARTHVPRVEVDDWDVPVGPVGYEVALEQEGLGTPLGEAFHAFIPRGVLERMAEASTVEGRLGSIEFELKRRDLEAVRLFLAALERAGLDPSADQSEPRTETD